MRFAAVVLLMVAAPLLAGENHDLQDAVMRTHLQDLRRQQQATEAALRRDFEQKFNRMLAAADEFSKAYNGANGSVWPHDKAEALRKAMQALQKHQQFRDESAKR